MIRRFLRRCEFALGALLLVALGSFVGEWSGWSWYQLGFRHQVVVASSAGVVDLSRLEEKVNSLLRVQDANQQQVMAKFNSLATPASAPVNMTEFTQRLESLERAIASLTTYRSEAPVSTSSPSLAVSGSLCPGFDTRLPGVDTCYSLGIDNRQISQCQDKAGEVKVLAEQYADRATRVLNNTRVQLRKLAINQ